MGTVLTGRLTAEDRSSLETAKKLSLKHYSARTRVEVGLVDSVVASLEMAGLQEWEIDLCQEWAGLGTPAGVSEECRRAKWLLDEVPLPDSLGVMDRERFWQQMGLGERLSFLWDAVGFLEAYPEPQTAFGCVARKVADYWRSFAKDRWPDVPDVYMAIRRARQRQQSKRAAKQGVSVGLAAVWRAMLALERAWHGRGYRSELNPEDVYEALGYLRDEVEIDCWGRDDETLVELFKKGPAGHGCTFCGVFTLDGYGFGFGSDGTTSCPRCGFTGSKLVELPKQDKGPTIPERGDRRYQWAIKHGMMWDEFLEKVVGHSTGRFDPAKKALCPLHKECDTRCAKDQRSGVRGWPLGSSDYAESCYKFREILWCRENAGTPEQFAEAEKQRLERLLKTQKRAAARRRKAARLREAADTEAPKESHESGEPKQMILL